MKTNTSWDDPQLSDGDFPSNQPKFEYFISQVEQDNN